jgi:uncharacterized protein YdhG (YjbR/CyaY superfamily)
MLKDRDLGSCNEVHPRGNMEKRTPAKTVDDYLAALPEDQRAALEKVRRAVREAAPEAEEVISYQMPGYRYKGMLVYFAAFRDHLSFFGAGKTLVKNFSKELEPFDVSGSTIHFSVEPPRPTALVKRMVRARMKENEERAKLRMSRPSQR